MHLIDRVLFKLQQIRRFALETRTPAALILDSLKLRMRPFVAISSDGLKLRLNPSVGESFTFFENIIRKDYLSGGIKLKSGDTVVDIGANIGSFALLAASIVGPEGRVVCFEPIPAAMDRLRSNITLNGFANVSCFAEAIEAKSGSIDIYATKKSSLSSARIVRKENDQADRITVPTTTLEAAIKRSGLRHINLLKLDCEGSEYGIFETLIPSVADLIDQIAMEVHPVAGKTKSGLAEQITQLGFTLHQNSLCWVAFRQQSLSAREADMGT